MKNTFIFCFIAFSLSSFFAQQQIANSNMEEWDNIGAATEEPTNWNGFKSASGGLSAFAIFCNLPQYVPESYKRFLENRIREQFDFEGVPVKIFFRKK